MGEEINIVFAILLLVAFVSVVKGGGSRRRRRELEQTIARLQSAQAGPPPRLSGPTTEQFERMEERVRVLERIVTDRGYALAAEIEALRDAPVPRQAELERNN